jgi:alkylation response protein AidB-like acyl-CoA dehydrogenase
VPPRTINYLGNEAQQKRRGCRSSSPGDWVSTAAITEPAGGLRHARLQDDGHARRGDDYVVNAQKRWIKLGG